MKQFITAVALLFFSIQCMAQSGAVITEPQQSLAQKMARVFEPLDKSQLVTGYLYDQAPPLVSPARYRGSIDENNAADINQFGVIYGHIINSFNMGGVFLRPLFTSIK